MYFLFFFHQFSLAVALLVILARKSPLVMSGDIFYILGGGFGLSAITAENYEVLVLQFCAAVRRQEAEANVQESDWLELKMIYRTFM